MHREIGFWVSVGLVAVVAVALFKLLGAKVGEMFPPLSALANFI